MIIKHVGGIYFIRVGRFVGTISFIRKGRRVTSNRGRALLVGRA